MDEFSVRRATSSDEIKSVFITMGMKESGRKYGKYDHKFFFDVDPTGYFIGELNGKPISCVSAAKYGNEFVFCGFYMVEKEYRGKGFGWKMCQAGMTSVDENYTCGLYALPEKAHMFERAGFKKTGQIKAYIINASNVLQVLKPIGAPQGIAIKLITEVSFDKLAAYDSSAFGAPHHAYLRGLLSTPEHFGFVALDETSNDVAGMIVARKAMLDEDGWIVAPLYANDVNIAKHLLKVALKELDPNEVVILHGCTQQFNEVAVDSGGTVCLDMASMINKQPPPDWSSIYIVSSPYLG